MKHSSILFNILDFAQYRVSAPGVIRYFDIQTIRFTGKSMTHLLDNDFLRLYHLDEKTHELRPSARQCIQCKREKIGLFNVHIP